MNGMSQPLLLAFVLFALVMYFTPLDKPAGGYIQTIGIRWNPKVKRYESLDRTYEQFLGESPTLEIPDVSRK